MLKIANVISRQLRVRFRQLSRAQRVVAIVKLFRAQKFARRPRGQFKSLGWLDLVQFLQNPITVRPLRLTEDVKAAEPGGEGDSGQQQNRDGPGKVIDPASDGARVRFVVSINAVVHLDGRGDSDLRVQADCVTSNDVPQPQVRLAFGLTI